MILILMAILKRLSVDFDARAIRSNRGSEFPYPLSVRIKSSLAIVFSESETPIYLDGNEQMIGPPMKPRGDVVFVIGSIGLDNPFCYFHGQVRSVRISRGEEYTSDFAPEEDLMANEAIELLYTSYSIEGNTAKDLSGKGNDGKVKRIGE